MAQLLSPVVHAGMQSRMAANPILSAFCLPDSPEAAARAQRLMQQLPVELREQLAQDHLKAERLCQLGCGLAAGATAPPLAAVSLVVTRPANSERPVRDASLVSTHPARIQPPATGPPA